MNEDIKAKVDSISTGEGKLPSELVKKFRPIKKAIEAPLKQDIVSLDLNKYATVVAAVDNLLILSDGSSITYDEAFEKYMIAIPVENETKFIVCGVPLALENGKKE